MQLHSVHVTRKSFVVSLMGIACILPFFLVPTSFANNDKQAEIKLSSGFDYTTGKYGRTQSTEMLYIPVSLKYKSHPATYKLTVPYIQIDGPGGVVAGTDGAVIIGQPTNNKTQSSGLGDVTLSAQYALDVIWDLPFYLDAKGKAKIATADEKKGLGTGENDYKLQLEIADTWNKKTTPFASVAYKYRGDPDGVELNNTWSGALGLDQKINTKRNAGLSLDFGEASSDSSDSIKEMTAYFKQKITRSTDLTVYGVGGFSDGSPDWGVGAQIGYQFDLDKRVVRPSNSQAGVSP